MFLVAVRIVSAEGIAEDPQPTDQPNIVFIISDDQSWTDYSFMGHKSIETPNIDKLAKRSAVFTRGYVPTALCRPSLMTLATGLYAFQHKTSGNDPSRAVVDSKTKAKQYKALRTKLIEHVDQYPTLPRILSERGYVSHQSGKWWEGSFQRGGFTHGMTRGFPKPGGRHGDAGLKIGREGMKPVFDFIDDSVDAKKPFFVWYAPLLPHTPHTPPKRLLDKYKAKTDSLFIAKYHAMCELFDETVGQLVEHIDKRGQTNNTLVVFIGDNGWIQNPNKRGFALRSKQSSNEGGTRQPTLFCWPNVIKPGDRDKQLCSSVDIMPTLLAAAGADVPKRLPGVNLLPTLKSGEPTPRKEILGEGYAHDIHDIEAPEKSLLYRWVIVGRWKLLLTYDGEVRRKDLHPRTERRPQLFDLIADPHESKNLAADNPEVVARLVKKLADWYAVPNRKVLTEWAPE